MTVVYTKLLCGHTFGHSSWHYERQTEVQSVRLHAVQFSSANVCPTMQCKKEAKDPILNSKKKKIKINPNSAQNSSVKNWSSSLGKNTFSVVIGLLVNLKTLAHIFRISYTLYTSEYAHEDKNVICQIQTGRDERCSTKVMVSLFVFKPRHGKTNGKTIYKVGLGPS